MSATQQHGSVGNLRQRHKRQRVRLAGELWLISGVLRGRPPTDPQALPNSWRHCNQSQMAAGALVLSGPRVAKAVTPICLSASAPLCTRIQLSISLATQFFSVNFFLRTASRWGWRWLRSTSRWRPSWRHSTSSSQGNQATSWHPSWRRNKSIQQRGPLPSLWSTGVCVHACVCVCVWDRVQETSSLVKHLLLITASGSLRRKSRCILHYHFCLYSGNVILAIRR